MAEGEECLEKLVELVIVEYGGSDLGGRMKCRRVIFRGNKLELGFRVLVDVLLVFRVSERNKMDFIS